LGVQGEFDYNLDFENTDFRENLELYRVGKGEQGVLLVEPYKSELLPHWRFKNPEAARESSEEIYDRFLGYRETGYFVGMDVARKFLRRGYTRARCYANHRSGRKHEDDSGKVRDQDEGALEGEKAQAARIFYAKYILARDDRYYTARRKSWAEKEKAGEDPTG
jgi:hypothetical protein